GSTDAAAALRLLNRFFGARLSARELRKIGLEAGADVPFCVEGGAALAEGV
ncbi:MAG TPA: 4-(cytidine 5'-diphospho)-2-C-methyl-D-erythritol kinase, partial [Ruminococcaceae bacterium]|nr:4-(cytidine 5'-diphospho)-2-C-methyl-D-erythritol kinase [Oscillospiraceae bacterium]